MAIRARSRTFLIGAAVAALLASVALLATTQATASATTGKAHDVRMYKVEKYFSIDGEFPDDTLDTYLQCNPNDYVADGMWRIDSVDDVWDEGDFYAGDPLNVNVAWSYPDFSDRTRWNFKLQNFNEGRVQGHLWVTCINENVDSQYSHTHALVVNGVVGFNTANGGDFVYTRSNECGNGYLPIAPGFIFNDGSGHLFRSRPAGTGWEWGFKTNGPTNVNVYLRCLRVKTAAAGNGPHAHNLIYKYGSEVRHVPETKRWEETYSCDGSYKALVHSFNINDYNHVWFLGMDPRIRSRAYTFMRSSGASDDRVDVGALCVRASTGKQIAP